MTRQQKSISDSASRRLAPILAPVRPSRNLTEEVIARVVTEISAGRLTPGQRLPTELEMMSAMKVSRTVVREAVSALRAQGLVVTRQGSGAFVSEAPGRQGFKLDPELLRSLDAVIDVLELRQAVETEAVERACERATAAGVRTIKSAHAAFVRAIDRKETGADEDFAFHLAIAAATGNPQFPEFLRFLGTFVIPRQNVRVWGMTFARQAEYLARIKNEHARIVDAVVARNGPASRQAMRDHLTLAAARYRHFATSEKVEESVLGRNLNRSQFRNPERHP